MSLNLQWIDPMSEDWYWVNPSANNGSVGVYFENIPKGSSVVGYSVFLMDNGEFNGSLGNTPMTLHMTDSFGAPIYQKRILLTLGETPDGTLYWYGGEIFLPKILLTGNGVSLGSAFLPAPCAGIPPQKPGPWITAGVTYGGNIFKVASALAVIPGA